MAASLHRIKAAFGPARARSASHFFALANPVAQICNLLYRRFPICGRHAFPTALRIRQVSRLAPKAFGAGRRRAEAALWRVAEAESRRYGRLGNLRYFSRAGLPSKNVECTLRTSVPLQFPMGLVTDLCFEPQ